MQNEKKNNSNSENILNRQLSVLASVVWAALDLSLSTETWLLGRLISPLLFPFYLVGVFRYFHLFRNVWCFFLLRRCSSQTMGRTERSAHKMMKIKCKPFFFLLLCCKQANNQEKDKILFTFSISSMLNENETQCNRVLLKTDTRKGGRICGLRGIWDFFFLLILLYRVNGISAVNLVLIICCCCFSTSVFAYAMCTAHCTR